MNVGDISAREAARRPHKEAIVDPVRGRRVTYAELERRVGALAHALDADPRVERGDRVVILATNCVEYFEVYFAAARAGLIAQGLNWRLAGDELARIIDSVEPVAFICDGDFAAQAEQLQGRLDIPIWLSFGEKGDGSYDEYVEAGARREQPLDAGDPDRGILIVYTGGTTGEAKGALHTDRGCVAAMVNNTVAERIVPADRYLLQGQMFHSAAILAFNYLMNGATVVLLPRFEPELSLQTVEAERVSASLAFPAMLNYILAVAESGTFDLSSLRNLQYGGGPMAPEVILATMDALPCSLIQNYGSSEHIGVTFLSQEDHREAHAGRNTHRLRSCGREALLTRVTLLDEGGAVVPHDGKTAGEIYVRAPSNMAGYWRRPDLTAAITRGSWQGTGDLAVWDEDGYLYVVGRVKDVIISGGENIYPIQVENAIAAHPDVLEVAVVGMADELWGESVAAYVVLKTGAHATEASLRESVRDVLGSYQKPKTVRFLGELPKSAAGKVEKGALRALHETPSSEPAQAGEAS
jgi:acyl-CoA synthetase (AMP-forming)/AMP-acid ligase II